EERPPADRLDPAAPKFPRGQRAGPLARSRSGPRCPQRRDRLLRRQWTHVEPGLAGTEPRQRAAPGPLPVPLDAGPHPRGRKRRVSDDNRGVAALQLTRRAADGADPAALAPPAP